MTRCPSSIPAAMRIALVALALAGASGGAAGAEEAEGRTIVVEGGGTYTLVSVTGLARMLEQKAFTLINVHVPYDGEIQGTDLFIPFDRIEAEAARLPGDRRARLVVYCRSGAMSAVAARALVALGYTDVWDVEGGMRAWVRAGHVLVQKAR